MDAFTPDPPVTPTPPESRPKTSLEPECDPRDTIRAPSLGDPEVDASSTVSDLITYGRHALTQHGLATRVSFLWRRRAWKAL